MTPLLQPFHVVAQVVNRPLFPAQPLLYALIFGLLGIVLTVFGFKVFDWVLAKVDVEKELAEKQNLAVAIVVAAVILGVSWIVVTAIS